MNESKFDGMGAVYSQYRPSYPNEFIEYLYTEVGISENSVIADIGSGTGILTQLLLNHFVAFLLEILLHSLCPDYAAYQLSWFNDELVRHYKCFSFRQETKR